MAVILRDRVRPGVRVLLVGINPGVRSAAIGHHFAGYSNRFWKLLHESGLVSEPIGAQDDERLPEWGLGVTNLIARMTPGIDTLRPDEYVAGLRTLRRKVRRWKPAIVAFVGVSLYRAIFTAPAARARTASRRLQPRMRTAAAQSRAGLVPREHRRMPVTLGPQQNTFEGARVFVLPNPSGRNANFSYAEMLAAFRTLESAARGTWVEPFRH
ncbi:MAG: mismatch-specific DNA-glycosylase [Acidobacteria bacterium]|nr:MAG: mismatch-specific DNA-glycosylase [Acidobacteriota bacterium]